MSQHHGWNGQRTALVLLVAECISITACGAGFDAKKFDAVHRAGQAVATATEIGVNTLNYRQLVQTFATELSLARDSAVSDREKSVVMDYEVALQSYRDAMTIWDAQREERSNSISATAPILALVKTYGLTIIPTSGSAPNRLDSDQALTVIWKAASERINDANKALIEP